MRPWAKNADYAYEVFSKYKTDVPVCGGVILDPTLENVLLVRGWNAKSWSFPRGKINKDESALSCSIREVQEEVGFDISPYLVPFKKTSAANTTSAGLFSQQPFLSSSDFDSSSDTPVMENNNSQDNLDRLRMNDDDFKYYFFDRLWKEKRVRMYLAIGVSKSTKFETQTRKEISEIGWHRIGDLLGTSPSVRMGALVLPFLAAIRSWIASQSTESGILAPLLKKRKMENLQNKMKSMTSNVPLSKKRHNDENKPFRRPVITASVRELGKQVQTATQVAQSQNTANDSQNNVNQNSEVNTRVFNISGKYAGYSKSQESKVLAIPPDLNINDLSKRNGQASGNDFSLHSSLLSASGNHYGSFFSGNALAPPPMPQDGFAHKKNPAQSPRQQLKNEKRSSSPTTAVDSIPFAPADENLITKTKNISLEFKFDVAKIMKAFHQGWSTGVVPPWPSFLGKDEIGSDSAEIR